MASLLPKPSSSATKTLATTRLLLLRRFSTANHNNRHQETHKFEAPNEFLNSWDPPKNPKEAQSKLALLRRQYGKQVKEIRKEYIQEMEALRLEKLRKDEAKMEALRKLNEERRAAKLAAKKLKAAERKVFEDEFRLTLLKERTEKLEYWREREKLVLEKKEKKNALLQQQSSIWIDESELEKKIEEATADTIAL